MLKVELLGKFSVTVDGAAIDRWQRRDAAQLLKLLAVELGHRATRRRIIEALWPLSTGSASPETRLSNALYVLRKTLEPGHERGQSRYVDADADIIRFRADAPIEVDIDQFEQLLDIGLIDERSTAELTRALELYGGALLPQDEGPTWTTHARHHLEQRYIGGLRALSRRQMQQGDDDGAIATLQRLTRALPTEEAAHRELILLFTRSGRSQEAQRQYEQCREVLAIELGAAPAERTRQALTLVPASEARVAERTEELDVPNQRSFAPPALLQPLIDRDREEEAVCAFYDAGNRIVTLTGPGGVGKSQLAVQVANRLRDRYRHGACFVSLSEVVDASAVARTIGRALGLKPNPSSSWEDLLRTFAADHHVLLVLDNFEHVLAAAPLVTTMIASGMRLHVLNTSLAPLNIAGEMVLSVPPLQLPSTESVPLAALEEVSSVALFVKRAQAADAGFQLTETNAEAITALCLRLDGLPLAIELAAARVKLFGPHELQRRLEHRFDLLHRGRRDSPERHRSLDAVLSWGYHLLDAETQRVFSWLGLFSGNVTLIAIQGVLREDDDAVADALDLLLEHHFVAVVEPAAGDGSERRYGMLQTVRAFALEQLVQSGDEAIARERFAQYWTVAADAIQRERVTGHAERACQTFEIEYGNFETAVDWASTHDRAMANRFVAMLAPFWAMRGFGVEGKRWVEAIVVHDGPHDIDACQAAGELLFNFGHYAEAMPHALHALDAAQVAGNARRTVDALRLVAHLHALMGRRRQATTVFRQALRCALPLEDDSLTASCRNGLGTLLRHQGEYTEASLCFEQALEKIDCVSEAMASGILFNLSLLMRLRGRNGDARQLCAQAVEHARASHDLRKLGCVLVDFGELMLLTGSVDEGVIAIDEAHGISRRVGDSFLAGCALQQMGAASVLEGRPTEAVELLEASLRVHREADCGDQVDITLLWLARAHRLNGSFHDALEQFIGLLMQGPKIRHYLLPSILEEGVRLLIRQGRLPQACQALALAQHMRNRFALVRPQAEEVMVNATQATLQSTLGVANWRDIPVEPLRLNEDDPLKVLDDALRRGHATKAA